MSSYLAFMSVANKVGQKVKKFILRFLSEKYNRRIMLYLNAFKNYFKVSIAWIVQPQTAEKKVHASVISLKKKKKKKKKQEHDYHSCEHFVT